MALQMTLLFALTLFSSATLLFLVQPMVGKILLPYLGGTPSVWNTCMVFFQAALLGGYTYAHWLTKNRPFKSQIFIHGIVLGLAFLPLAIMRFDAGILARSILPPPTSSNPSLWLLFVLTLVAGLPFFAVSTSAPLLQKWFSTSDHPDAKDPYFLYGASNLGSMIGLLIYPFVIEPKIGVATQATLWVFGYAGLMALTFFCARMASKNQSNPISSTTTATEASPGILTRLRWIALAFIPSSLMLGTTTYLTTDIAAIPLLWILPLSLYILSFILVFSNIPRSVYLLFVISLPLMLFAKSANLPEWQGFGFDSLMNWLDDAARALKKDTTVSFFQIAYTLLGILFVGIFFKSHNRIRLGMVVITPVLFLFVVFMHQIKTALDLREVEIIGIHLALLFVTAMLSHGELARTRPPATHLTEFYLLMSLGGVLGGIFNALVSPIVFPRILEYPLVAAFGLILLPGFSMPAGIKFLAFPIRTASFLVGIVSVAIILIQNCLDRSYALEKANNVPEFVRSFARMIATGCNDRTNLLFEERNFFGCFTIQKWESPTTGEMYHTMYHGTTNHGMQCVEPADRRLDTLTYFHKLGAIGQLFEAVEKKKNGSPVNMGVLGVGTGTLAAYTKKGWNLTMYEIDPAVVKSSIDRSDYFSFVTDAKARDVKVDIVLGDGRLQFLKAPDASYDLIFMDAFTSDAVPVHLLTREAFDIYLKKLAPGGIIVLNIANRYLDFEHVLGNMTEDRKLVGMIQGGYEVREIDKYGTNWVVMARKTEDFGVLPDLKAELKTDSEDWVETWRKIESKPKLGVWTDDYSNLPSIFKWSR
ncbi:MAG: hypothetical protein RL179_2263 [Planctomycetota bacterium]